MVPRSKSILLQLAPGTKSDEAAVRREERANRALGARKGPSVELQTVTQVEL